jgi:hypothetical protein
MQSRNSLRLTARGYDLKVVPVPARLSNYPLKVYYPGGQRYGAIFAYRNDFYKGVMAQKFGNKHKIFVSQRLKKATERRI